MQISINYLVVLVAAIASMAVGFLWYSPFLFGKPWMKLMGYTATSMKAAQKKMGPMYGVSFLLTLITGYALALVTVLSINFFRYEPIIAGLTSGFWMWLGFVMPVQFTGVIFGNRHWKLFAMDTGYQLVSMLVMGIIIGVL